MEVVVGAGLRAAKRGQDATAKSQASRIMSFMGDPDVGMTGPIWQALKLWAGLEQACLFLSTVSSTWTDRAVAEAVEDLAAQGAPCVEVQEGDAKAVL